MKVVFRAESASFDAELNDSPAAKAIAGILPLESTASSWGDEIYFGIGVDCPVGERTMELKAGDIGYWPQGRCLCVFFGPTPASEGNKPVPASPVVVVGKTGAPQELLRKITDGETITVTAAG